MFDILLSDIDIKDIHEIIPRRLKIDYLSDTLKEFNGDIYGIIFGPQLRLFYVTTVRRNDKIKIMTFLVDTGLSTTYISKEVLDAFGITMVDLVNDYINVKINSRATRVMMSRAHFKDVNVIRMSYFNVNDINAYIHSSKEIFHMHFFNQEYDINQINHDLRKENVELKRYEKKE